MIIKKILLKNSGVKAFEYCCSACRSNNIIYLADGYSDKNATAALCSYCNTTFWCNLYLHPILKKMLNPPFQSGELYRKWHQEVIAEFLNSIGECLNCGGKDNYQLITNKPSRKKICSFCKHDNLSSGLIDVTDQHLEDQLNWMVS